jgi:hypothetical protein
MLEPGREPRTGRSRYQPTQRNPQRGCYLALTFGTLLSSQGADALVPQPFGLRSRRYPHSTPRSASVKPRGLVRRFPRLAARSVLARCRDDSTPLSGPRARGFQEGSCPLLAGPVARTGDALGAAGRPLVGGRVVERRPHRLPSHRSRPAFPGVGGGVLPSSRCRDDTGHPRRLSRRVRAPRRGAGCGWPATGAVMSRRERTSRVPSSALPAATAVSSQRRTDVTRRHGDGTARSPADPRAWSSSGCGAPTCADRSPP